ncbi:uncharacterized protein LOC143459023 isoform X2 [Clavelina lepadiformis]|uniref:uncharacterized protein LOC143459023 isoform X2 n=1 Tax=Clavelina lepadiformis TaxID=159417 RepID=UPI004041FA7B
MNFQMKKENFSHDEEIHKQLSSKSGGDGSDAKKSHRNVCHDLRVVVIKDETEFQASNLCPGPAHLDQRSQRGGTPPDLFNLIGDCSTADNLHRRSSGMKRLRAGIRLLGHTSTHKVFNQNVSKTESKVLTPSQCCSRGKEGKKTSLADSREILRECPSRQDVSSVPDDESTVPDDVSRHVSADEKHDVDNLGVKKTSSGVSSVAKSETCSSSGISGNNEIMKFVSELKSTARKIERCDLFTVSEVIDLTGETSDDEDKIVDDLPRDPVAIDLELDKDGSKQTSLRKRKNSIDITSTDTVDMEATRFKHRRTEFQSSTTTNNAANPIIPVRSRESLTKSIRECFEFAFSSSSLAGDDHLAKHVKKMELRHQPCDLLDVLHGFLSFAHLNIKIQNSGYLSARSRRMLLADALKSSKTLKLVKPHGKT